MKRYNITAHLDYAVGGAEPRADYSVDECEDGEFVKFADLKASKICGTLADVPYPLRLCAEVVHYCVFLSEKTALDTCGDLTQRINALFGKALVDQAFALLSGKLTGETSSQPTKG
jgi:hypothetical protein